MTVSSCAASRKNASAFFNCLAPQESTFTKTGSSPIFVCASLECHCACVCCNLSNRIFCVSNRGHHFVGRTCTGESRVTDLISCLIKHLTAIVLHTHAVGTADALVLSSATKMLNNPTQLT